MLFPLLQYTETEEEMWDEEPEGYVRAKHDIFEELHNPAASAASLLQAASKRVGIMMPVLNFVITKLSDAKTSEKDIDASLNIIGILSQNLIKNKVICSIYFLELNFKFSKIEKFWTKCTPRCLSTPSINSLKKLQIKKKKQNPAVVISHG